MSDNLKMEVFRRFSVGLLSRTDAFEQLGLRDHTDLLMAIGDAGSADEVKKQAEILVRIYRGEKE